MNRNNSILAGWMKNTHVPEGCQSLWPKISYSKHSGYICHADIAQDAIMTIRIETHMLSKCWVLIACDCNIKLSEYQSSQTLSTIIFRTLKWAFPVSCCYLGTVAQRWWNNIQVKDAQVLHILALEISISETVWWNRDFPHTDPWTGHCHGNGMKETWPQASKNGLRGLYLFLFSKYS